MAEKKRNISIRLDAAGTAAVEEAKRMTGERTASKALLRMPGLARRWLLETQETRHLHEERARKVRNALTETEKK